MNESNDKSEEIQRLESEIRVLKFKREFAENEQALAEAKLEQAKAQEAIEYLEAKKGELH